MRNIFTHQIIDRVTFHLKLVAMITLLNCLKQSVVLWSDDITGQVLFQNVVFCSQKTAADGDMQGRDDYLILLSVRSCDVRHEIRPNLPTGHLPSLEEA